MDREKVEFAKTSIEKSSDFKNDSLIEFVILWIGLNALYNDNEGQEYEKFYRYISANEHLVKVVLSKEKAELKSIVDFVNQTHQHSRIREFIATRRAFLNPEGKDSTEHFAQFVYKIRNNMFHSEKPWNQADEAKLLEMVNPIIRRLISLSVEKLV